MSRKKHWGGPYRSDPYRVAEALRKELGEARMRLLRSEGARAHAERQLAALRDEAAGARLTGTLIQGVSALVALACVAWAWPR
jgi:hypothetical protein